MLIPEGIVTKTGPQNITIIVQCVRRLLNSISSGFLKPFVKPTLSFIVKVKVYHILHRAAVNTTLYSPARKFVNS